MIFSLSEILPIAESTGFKADVVEKVLNLLHLLNQMNKHVFLKEKWLLKGGTALNLFVFGMPRLSVDIDLNYIGALELEDMKLERPEFEKAAQAVFSREGLNVKRIPTEHAGGKWRLSYQSFTGQSNNLEVDVNFMFRQPLWDIQHVFLDSMLTHLRVYQTGRIPSSQERYIGIPRPLRAHLAVKIAPRWISVHHNDGWSRSLINIVESHTLYL